MEIPGTGLSEVLNSFYRFAYGVNAMVLSEDTKRKTMDFGTPEARHIRTSINGFGGLELSITPESHLPEGMRSAVLGLESMLTARHMAKSLTVVFENDCSPSALGILPDTWTLAALGHNGVNPDLRKGQLRFWRWLAPTECTIPLGATHNLGARAAVIKKIEGQVSSILCVQNQRRPKDWNLPGGSFDVADGYSSLLPTALRELKEEAGFDGQGLPARLVVLSHFPDNQYAGAINPVWQIDGTEADQPLVPQEGEVIRAEWIPIASVNAGSHDGLKIGTDIQRAANATVGLEYLEGSPNWMPNFAVPSAP